MREYLGKGKEIINNSNHTYCVDKIIGAGASCVAYSAKDNNGNRYIIKEFYPSYIDIHRNEDNSLSVNKSEYDKYSRAKDKFINGIRIQRFLRENGELINNQIFAVIDEFNANNTYYSVVTEFQGETFRNNERISLFDRVRICKSVAEYVKEVHSAGYLCLDIKPSNIYVLPETREFTMMFDFDGVCSKDEVSFGNNLSYTEEWAAPEQLISNAYNRISEQTDIYLLGELLFWSVFNRHSTDEEHRKTSKYSYEYSILDDTLSPDIELMLNEIFHHTLRSSTINRYNYVQDYIDALDNVIIKLYPHQERILDIKYTNESFFIGRENEIELIDKMLCDGNKVFLKGIGGIGKSEITKKYVEKFSDKYNHIIYMVYENSLLYTIKNSCFISNFEQREKEADDIFVRRKINKFKDLTIDANSLIIIDGVNIELECIDNKDIWNDLIELSNCKFIISSRCNQELYSKYQIEISQLTKDELVCIFSNYCSYEEVEKDNVLTIIEKVGFHTLTVELIAKQTNMSRSTPGKLLKRLKEEGVLSLNNEPVKWNLEVDSVERIINGLFDMSELSEEQIDLLIKLALVPETGGNEQYITQCYKLDSYKEIQFLIDNGWVSESSNDSKVLKMHPVISSVVVKRAYNNGKLKDYCRVMIQQIYDHYKELSFDSYFIVYICAGMMLYDKGIHTEYVADYLLMLAKALSCGYMGKVGNFISLLAKNLYEKTISDEKYDRRKELAYIFYIDSQNQIDDEDINDIDKHLIISNHIKDDIMTLKWKITKYKALHKLRIGENEKKQHNENLYKASVDIAVSYFKSVLKKSSENKNLNKDNYGLLKDYRYVFFNDIHSEIEKYYESDNDYEVFSIKNPINYVQSNRIRKISRYSKSNFLLERINMSKIDIIKNNYSKAKSDLAVLKYHCEKRNYTNSEEYIKILRLMGGLLYILKEYDDAKKYFEYLILLEPHLDMKENYYNYIYLSRVCIFTGDTDKAEQINCTLLNKIEKIKPYDYDLILGEILYNRALLFMNDNKFEEAFDKFLDALNCFTAFPIANSISVVGFSRCLLGRAEIRYYNSEKEVALERMRIALKGFKRSVGEKHPEYIKCKERIKEIESEK